MVVRKLALLAAGVAASVLAPPSPADSPPHLTYSHARLRPIERRAVTIDEGFWKPRVGGSPRSDLSPCRPPRQVLFAGLSKRARIIVEGVRGPLSSSGQLAIE